jgi:DNA-binding NtrC family response regulator
MMKAFLRHYWQGNVRELENMIQRFVVLGNEKAIIEELALAPERDPDYGKKKKVSNKDCVSLKDLQKKAVKKAEAEMILKALEMTNWNRKKAAKMLKISYKAFLYKIKECGLDKPHISQSP